jgi:hypothetical protein
MIEKGGRPVRMASTKQRAKSARPPEAATAQAATRISPGSPPDLGATAELRASAEGTVEEVGCKCPRAAGIDRASIALTWVFLLHESSDQRSILSPDR